MTGTILASMHQEHKARQLRIRQAAFKDLTVPQQPIEIIPELEPQPPPLALLPLPLVASDIKTRGFLFDTILKEVCAYYRVRAEDILSGRRLNNIALPRHILIYLLCRMTKYTTHQIAPKVGRDPATVLYAFKKIDRDIDTYRADLDILEPRIRPLLPAW